MRRTKMELEDSSKNSEAAQWLEWNEAEREVIRLSFESDGIEPEEY